MIALVDCNNFFASCERLFRPDLQGRPVLVLSNNDGCVVARSEEVKALGISMGVPYFKVRDIIVKNNVQCFSSNFALYSALSQRVLSVFSDHAPQIEVYSIDEAFMDLSQFASLDFTEWGNDLSAKVDRIIGLPVSIGIAPTKTLAKIASSYAKKHRRTCFLDPKNEEVYQDILSKTPVEAMWGVGWRMAPKFQKAGIRNALQLSQVSEPWIHSQMGINGTRLLKELNGIAMYPFEAESAPQKTLVASRSFGHTIKNIHDLESAVASFASQAAYRLRAHGQVAGIFGVYLRYKTKDAERKAATAATQFAVASNDTSQLVQTALELLYQLYDEDNGYIKAGVFANHLTSANISQLYLFDKVSAEHRERRTSFMRALDDINQRFGSQTIHVGSINPTLTKWHAQKNRMSPSYLTDWNQLPLVYTAK
ncbi:MAG: Y-family DNA polymerase [Candidatus Saccharimonadales bacterium]